MFPVQAERNYFLVRNQKKEKLRSYSFRERTSINKLESHKHHACPDTYCEMVIWCQPAMWNA